MRTEWANGINLGRNDECICGSGKKLKKCCLGKIQTSKRMLHDIRVNNFDYGVSKFAITERGIGEF